MYTPVLQHFILFRSYTTFTVDTPVAPASIGPCDPLPLSVTLHNTGPVDSGCVVQVYLSQTGLSVPAPITRLVTFSKVFVPAGQSLVVTLPPISPEYRAAIHETGDIFAVSGKRWAEAGVLNLRVVTGEHNGNRAGGLGVTVTQTSTQDLSTC